MAIYVRDENGVLQAWEIPAYKGEKGEAGITPNLQIGDVITLESGQQATITRRGDDENPIFDFAIPKGENGEDGIFVGRIEDAPSHAQIVVNDDASPYDLFFENANVSYMGDTYTSLKEKADADIEYLLRKFGSQHYEGSSITATNTIEKRINNAIFRGLTKYRDKATGEIIDSFQEGKNLELVAAKSPSLTSYTRGTIRSKSEFESGTFDAITGQPLPFSNRIRTKGFYPIDNGGEVIFSPSITLERRVFFYNDSTFVADNGAWVLDEKIKILSRANRFKILFKADGVDFLPNNFYIMTDTDKISTLVTPSDLTLRGISNTQDTLDLNTGEYVKRIETRPYQQGDESNAEVLTDKVNTVYKLAQPITTKIDLRNQKVYSYDGTTHYTTASLDGHPAPILSIDVPINVTTIIAGQQEKLKQQEQRLQEQEEVQNLLIESQLAWFEDNITTLELTDEDTPSHIQKLYELTRKYKVEEE